MVAYQNTKINIFIIEDLSLNFFRNARIKTKTNWMKHLARFTMLTLHRAMQCTNSSIYKLPSRSITSRWYNWFLNDTFIKLFTRSSNRQGLWGRFWHNCWCSACLWGWRLGNDGPFYLEANPWDQDVNWSGENIGAVELAACWFGILCWSSGWFYFFLFFVAPSEKTFLFATGGVNTAGSGREAFVTRLEGRGGILQKESEMAARILSQGVKPR